MNGVIKNVGMVGGGVSLGLIITLAIGYGEVRKDVVHNTEDIVEVKGEVKENDGELVSKGLIDKEQSIYIEQMQQNQLKFIIEFEELQQAK